MERRYGPSRLRAERRRRFPTRRLGRLDPRRLELDTWFDPLSVYNPKFSLK